MHGRIWEVYPLRKVHLFLSDYMADFSGSAAFTFSTPAPMIAWILAADSSASALMPERPVDSSREAVSFTGRTAKAAPASVSYRYVYMGVKTASVRVTFPFLSLDRVSVSR